VSSIADGEERGALGAHADLIDADYALSMMFIRKPRWGRLAPLLKARG
jgi:hypothetical protein